MLSRGIFISYNWVDRDIAEQLTHWLRRIYGTNYVWAADDAHSGANRWVTVRHEIARCEVFIFLVSSDSLESSQCQMELEAARHWGKRVIPVRLDSDTTLPAALQPQRLIDMREGVTVETLTQQQGAINFMANPQGAKYQTRSARPAARTRPSITHTIATRPNRNIALMAPVYSPYQFVAPVKPTANGEHLPAQAAQTRQRVQYLAKPWQRRLSFVLLGMGVGAVAYWVYWVVHGGVGF